MERGKLTHTQIALTHTQKIDSEKNNNTTREEEKLLRVKELSAHSSAPEWTQTTHLSLSVCAGWVSDFLVRRRLLQAARDDSMLDVTSTVTVVVVAALASAASASAQFFADWSVLARDRQPSCVAIPANMSLCQNVGYTKMRLPNLLDHDTMQEASQQASSWVPLLNIKCHQDTQVFLWTKCHCCCHEQPLAGFEDKSRSVYSWEVFITYEEWPSLQVFSNKPNQAHDVSGIISWKET